MRDQVKYRILPDTDNMIYEERETGITHSDFSLEYDLYTGIKNGNVIQVEQAIDKYMKSGFVVGRLSNDTLRQIKYWAVACISVGVHYAILGGVDETDAFNKSDEYIRYVDGCKSIEECISYLRIKAIELTGMVAKAPYHAIRSAVSKSDAISQCMHFVHIHLHERLRIADIADYLGISRDYLSTLFKKEVGTSLHAYIVREKLEAAEELLRRGVDNEAISYNLSFCSETHFISCFKKQYGMTPGEYKKNILSI